MSQMMVAEVVDSVDVIGDAVDDFPFFATVTVLVTAAVVPHTCTSNRAVKLTGGGILMR